MRPGVSFGKARHNTESVVLKMLIWAIILIIIALSLISGDFAAGTEEFLTEHALTILLVALGILYWWCQVMGRDKDE